MNIGAVMQEVYDVEERGLDATLCRLARLAETVALAGSELVLFILWFNSRRKQ